MWLPCGAGPTFLKAENGDFGPVSARVRLASFVDDGAIGALRLA